jgi:hypothetical protein
MSDTKSALQSLFMLATTRRPHPAVASGSGSPLPSLGEGLGVRARLMVLQTGFGIISARHRLKQKPVFNYRKI